MTVSNYYTHGYDAGQWVAMQIASYRALGVGLTPDWVILDPEGYPDNHSGLDAPGGASNATLALYATYWAAILKGWQTGIDSVDPALNAAVYASQSEYRNYQLSSLSLPVFIALAFGSDGEQRARVHHVRRGLLAADHTGERSGDARESTVGRSVQHAAVQRRRVLRASLHVVLAHERYFRLQLQQSP
jgi:hypothetical protein